MYTSVHMCTNDYLRYTEYKVHDRVTKHVIWCTKKRVLRFLILAVLLHYNEIKLRWVPGFKFQFMH